ncbi:Uncharacterised protein [Chlamydia trachomatis]|nr:Uncharacterised protein [Chlamydia trachomatis]
MVQLKPLILNYEFLLNKDIVKQVQFQYIKIFKPLEQKLDIEQKIIKQNTLTQLMVQDLLSTGLLLQF